MSQQPDNQNKRVRFDLRDGLGVIGVGLLSYGSWLIYQPAAFIIAGIIFLAAAIVTARR